MIFRIAVLCCAFFCVTSCKKDAIDLKYSTVAFIEGVCINDVLVLSDTIILFCGKTSLEQGRIGTFQRVTKKVELSKTDQIMHDLSGSADALWACGNNMCVLKSVDTGRVWNPVWDAVYTSEFYDEENKTDIHKIHAVGSYPVFAIGYKNMLDGKLYVQNENPVNPFKTKPLNMGVNDMLVVDSTEIYVAGYGSIVHVTGLDSNPLICSVGNENFTGITQVGTKSLVACTQAGALYMYNGIDSVWKKTYQSSMSLTHVVGDTYGNLLAVGNGRHVLVSNNYGESWRKVRYPNSKHIRSLSFDSGYFWAGTENGEIVRFDAVQIEK